jgi:hypothetical protein
MRWLRTVGALLAIATLFAIGWNFYMWVHRQEDRSVQSAPLPEERIKPTGRSIP